MKRSPISEAIIFALISTSCFSADESQINLSLFDLTLEDLLKVKIQVTATRREGSDFDVPFNLFALNGDQLEQRNINGLLELSNWAPGLTVQDQGNRQMPRIIIRGLNTTEMGPLPAISDGGGTVATYIGETPIDLDYYIHDIERVEVLIGPQGTLYGAGSLSGTIRYIPTAPQLQKNTLSLMAGLKANSQSNSTGHLEGMIGNWVLSPGKLALRASFIQNEMPGFVDYNYLVRDIGISDPEPNFNNPASVETNLTSAQDINALSLELGKISMLWQISNKLSTSFNYLFQQHRTNGRSLTHFETLSTDSAEQGFAPDKFENAYRVSEPLKQDYQMFNLGLVNQFDFADLTVSSSFSQNELLEIRDQTDLLLNFEYGYEDFPSFTAFARDDAKREVTTFEARLVSNQKESKWNWIGGIYYSQLDYFYRSKEFTPGLPEFYQIERPDNLEFISIEDKQRKELAFFGELGYQPKDNWQVSIGARLFKYKDTARAGFDLPLLNTLLGEAGPNDVNVVSSANSTDHQGSLFKLNSSYHFDKNLMLYLTLSNGYRIGGVNPVTPCDNDLNEGQQTICALANEQSFEPDLTLNKEFGIRSFWMENKLHFNATLFHIDWKDIQLVSRTENGGVDVLINGSDARSYGIELMANYQFNDNWRLNTNYAFTDAKLSQDSTLLNANKGDPLPGSPQDQFSAQLSYLRTLNNNLTLNISLASFFQGDVYTNIGRDSGTEKLSGYSTQNFSTRLLSSKWELGLSIENIFDQYAITSVRSNRNNIKDIYDDSGNRQFALRRYAHYINQPRTLSLNFIYRF